MKFHRGDRVYVKSLQKEAEIMQAVDADDMRVKLENGEELSLPESDLDFPYLYWFLKEKNKKQKKSIQSYDTPRREEAPAPKTTKGMYLVFWPEYHSLDFDDMIEEVKVYFHNETSHMLEFYYNYSAPENSGFELKKKVKAFEDFYLHKIPMEELLEKPKFKLELAPPGQKLSKVEVATKPHKIYEELNQLAEKNIPSLYVRISEDLYQTYVAPDDEEEVIDISKIQIGSKASSNIDKELLDRHSIDLHIDALYPENWKKINPRHILDVQVKTFQNFLSDAISNGEKKLTVIHGIGEGVLRDRVHEVLDQNNFVKRYQNELHPLYGYGATEIWLK